MRKDQDILGRVFGNRYFRHLLFWLFVWLIAPFTSNEYVNSTKEAFIFRTVAMPIKIIATYFLIYYEIPHLLRKRRYFMFVLYFLVSSLVFTSVYRINNIYIAETLAGYNHSKESIVEIITDVKNTHIGYFFLVYSYAILFLILKTFRDREIQASEVEKLQKEKVQAELNFLKAQIHPHFLFNTLNNLYVLTLDKSDEAPEVVAKLSEILDYILYQCNEEKVLIAKEIELINNYMDLERLRYGNRLTIDFDCQPHHSQEKIAPLILLSIIENAFKHGVSGTISSAVIKASLQLDRNELQFRVFNTRNDDTLNKDESYKNGIGEKNIKRQLMLIYPNQHEWQTNILPNSYEVILKIWI